MLDETFDYNGQTFAVSELSAVSAKFERAMTFESEGVCTIDGTARECAALAAAFYYFGGCRVAVSP
jgi:hypothetical protein